MTDDAILLIVDRLEGAPCLTIGRQRFYYLEAGPMPALVVVWHRVGNGQRWAWHPGRDLHPAAKPPIWIPREARAWLELAAGFDFVGHCRAMSARTL